MIQIHPYKLGSRGAVALRDWLENNGCHSIISSRMKKKGRLIVGWGAKEFNFDSTGSKVLNPPENTRAFTCKLKFLDKLKGNPFVPEWTTDPNKAKEWDDDIVVRHTTTGNSGDGIELLPRGCENVSKAPLYTKYQKKTGEYRVHCFKDEATGQYQLAHTQKKVFIKNGDREEPLDWKVRNHANGFTFCHTEAGDVPAIVFEACRSVLSVFGGTLHWVALDVIYHKPTNVALVLEGNTAPGLERDRLPLYGNYLKEIHRVYKGR